MNNNKITFKLTNFDLLTTFFVCLKLSNTINWSWWIVLLPTIITWGIFIVLMLISLIVYVFLNTRSNRYGI